MRIKWLWKILSMKNIIQRKVTMIIIKRSLEWNQPIGTSTGAQESTDGHAFDSFDGVINCTNGGATIWKWYFKGTRTGWTSAGPWSWANCSTRIEQIILSLKDRSRTLSKNSQPAKKRLTLMRIRFSFCRTESSSRLSLTRFLTRDKTLERWFESLTDLTLSMSQLVSNQWWKIQRRA